MTLNSDSKDRQYKDACATNNIAVLFHSWRISECWYEQIEQSRAAAAGAVVTTELPSPGGRYHLMRLVPAQTRHQLSRVTCHVSRVTVSTVPGADVLGSHYATLERGAWLPSISLNMYQTQANMIMRKTWLMMAPCSRAPPVCTNPAQAPANIRFIEMSWGRIQFNSFALHTQQPFREQLKYKIRKWVQTLNTLHIKVVNT